MSEQEARAEQGEGVQAGGTPTREWAGWGEGPGGRGRLPVLNLNVPARDFSPGTAPSG